MKARRTKKSRNWGGARAGAGRKPKGDVAGVAHRSRPVFARRRRVHVRLRLVPGVRVTTARARRAIAEAVGAAADHLGMRIDAFKVAARDIELVVDADHSDALRAGMKGLSVRLARRLNAVLGRTGRLFADRYEVLGG